MCFHQGRRKCHRPNERTITKSVCYKVVTSLLTPPGLVSVLSTTHAYTNVTHTYIHT